MIWRFIVDVVSAVLNAICCSHPNIYRERRELHGVLVPHLVCPDCAHTEPMVRRTPSQHQAAFERGALVPFRVTREPKPAPTDVTEFPAAARRSLMRASR